jgi:hypothetical protein
MDAFSGIAEFIRITAAKEHDRKFLEPVHNLFSQDYQ